MILALQLMQYTKEIILSKKYFSFLSLKDNILLIIPYLS